MQQTIPALSQVVELPAVNSFVLIRVSGQIIEGRVTSHGAKDGKPTCDFTCNRILSTGEASSVASDVWVWPEQIVSLPYKRLHTNRMGLHIGFECSVGLRNARLAIQSGIDLAKLEGNGLAVNMVILGCAVQVTEGADAATLHGLWKSRVEEANRITRARERKIYDEEFDREAVSLEEFRRWNPTLSAEEAQIMINACAQRVALADARKARRHASSAVTA